MSEIGRGFGPMAAAAFAMGLTAALEPHPLDRFVMRDRPSATKPEPRQGTKFRKRLKAGKKLWRP